MMEDDQHPKDSGALLSIIVPLWNEEGNIQGLVEMLGNTKAVREGRADAILVNNGSSDATGNLLEKYAASRDWINVVNLPANLNYGGGILAGCQRTAAKYLCYVPGDLQYLDADIDAVVSRLFQHDLEGRQSILVKGRRLTRKDGAIPAFVSSVYSYTARAVLGLPVRDVNGLPKAFHRSLLQTLPVQTMRNFVLDAQILYCASLNGWKIEEVEVTFYKRAAGVSSWSGKRLRVYVRSFRDLFVVRALRDRKFSNQTHRGGV